MSEHTQMKCERCGIMKDSIKQFSLTNKFKKQGETYVFNICEDCFKDIVYTLEKEMDK